MERELRVLSWLGNQPYYTEVEVVKEEEDKIWIRSFDKVKQMKFDDKKQAWYSVD